MKILGIGGSVRPNSFSCMAIQYAIGRVPAANSATEILHLANLQLPFCNGFCDYSDYPDVQKLRQSVRLADALVISTPEYHAGMSGVLKNALDLLEEEALKTKVIALIAVVGGVSSNNAINQLRIVLRQLRGWVLPEQLIIAHAVQAFNSKRQLVDPLLRQRLDEMLEELITMTKKLI
ncbi:FMN-dependent NADPH-azoreductase [Chlamydiales bacterium STE3]|nr:FMN-dependent NADPH-azoreductase [Chlamydiales bacterium STE3]